MRPRRHSAMAIPPLAVRLRGRPLSPLPENIPPLRPPLSPQRRTVRQGLSIPFRLRTYEKEVSGFTQDLSPHCLRIMSDTPLRAGTPVALQCNFAGICYLDLAGQVVFCKPHRLGTSPENVIEIKTSTMREWEHKILCSALREVTRNAASRENSLLTIWISRDALALEAGDFYVRTAPPVVERPSQIRQSCVHASKVIGWGAHVPPQQITNEDINSFLKVAGKKTRFGEVVGTVTGIRSRRYAGSAVYPSDLAAEASRQALKRAGVDPKDLDVIIYCGITRDVEEPATACILQEKIGAHNAYVFDVGNACNGFISALDILDSFIASGRCDVGLVTCGELISQYVNWSPDSKKDLRLSAMGYTLGDGGGAAVLSRINSGEQQGIKARWFMSDSSYWRVAVVPIGEPAKKLFRSNATEIEQTASEYIPMGIEKVLKALQWNVSDLDVVIPHQVGIHVVTQILYKKLGIPQEKVSWPFPKYGNVGAASMPIAVCEAFQEARARQGDKALFVGGSGGFGAGIMGVVL